MIEGLLVTRFRERGLLEKEAHKLDMYTVKGIIFEANQDFEDMMKAKVAKWEHQLKRQFPSASMAEDLHYEMIATVHIEWFEKWFGDSP
jgi:hypothetical protein